MRLVTYRDHDIDFPGIIVGDRIHRISNHPDVKSALTAPDGIEYDRTRSVALGDAVLLPPIQNPGKIICIGLNYDEHRRETNRPDVGHPTVFIRWADSQVGHAQPMLKPAESERFDYEGELAVVIGAAGRHIPAERALEHVAGYACYNDGSVRDWQKHTSQFAPGKNFPGTGAFGPWLVVGEIPDPHALTLTTRLNGEVMQNSSTDKLIFDIPTLIAYISTFTELNIGDVIVSGTPGGVGDRRDPPRYLRPGDTVEVEISGIGTLRNGVEAAK